MRKKFRIALLFDFDDTLCHDSTTGFLNSLGIDTSDFWKTAANLVKKGYDPVLAFMDLMIQLSQKGKYQGCFTLNHFKTFAETLSCFPGVESLFSRLKADVKAMNSNAELEFYVISSGLYEILSNTKIAHEFKSIFASSFTYDPGGGISLPKRVVSFTDKTRFLFSISKGISQRDYFRDPLSVNVKIPREDYAIPFKRMIYVGDGYTDIPCFVLLKKSGGYGIGVYKRGNKSRALSLLEDERVSFIAGADYSAQGRLTKRISQYLSMICKEPS